MTAPEQPNPKEDAMSYNPNSVAPHIRCSKRCGGGCTEAAFQRATQEATALAARLGGPWKPHVWENFGWHYLAVAGVCEVSVCTHGSHIRPDWSVCGYIGWVQTRPQFVSGVCGDPEDAIRDAAMQMQVVFDAFAGSVGAASDLLPKLLPRRPLTLSA